MSMSPTSHPSLTIVYGPETERALETLECNFDFGLGRYTAKRVASDYAYITQSASHWSAFYAWVAGGTHIPPEHLFSHIVAKRRPSARADLVRARTQDLAYHAMNLALDAQTLNGKRSAAAFHLTAAAAITDDPELVIKISKAAVQLAPDLVPEHPSWSALLTQVINPFYARKEAASC